jgi:exopolysaccharide production protein ExoZ
LLFHTNALLSLPKYLGREAFPLLDDTGVHFFFVVSGFVMMLAHGKDLGRPDKVLEFFQKRFRRIYPLLWCTLAIVVPLCLLLPRLGPSEATQPLIVLSAIFALPAKAEYLLGVEWTLRHEILFYFDIGLCIWKPRIGIPFALIWCVASAIAEFVGLPYPWSFFLSGYHSLFGFGAIAAILYAKGFRKLPVSMVLAGFALYFATPMTIRLHILEKGELVNLLYGLASAMVILGSINTEQLFKLQFPRFVILLGEASYAIYLAHFPALAAVAKVVSRLDHKVPDLVIFTITAVGAGAVVLAFHLYVEKPLIAVLRKTSRPSPATAKAGEQKQAA